MYARKFFVCLPKFTVYIQGTDMEKTIQITMEDRSCIPAAAAEFLKKTQGKNIIAFYAKMGGGKTTFITELCRQLGVEDTVCSPTFTIVNEYEGARGQAIYHFDFYRVEKLSEAMDIGVEEYFDSGALCLIEWPENIEELLPEETLRVRIDVDDRGKRTISF